MERRSTVEPFSAVEPLSAMKPWVAMEAESERNPRADGVDSGERNPAGISDERGAIHEPRIVGGHVDDLGVGRLDDDRLALRGDGLLGCRLEVTRLLRSLAHRLNGV